MSGEKKAKVIVVGAAGSIGTAVCRDLTRDYEVLALVGPGFQQNGRYADLDVSWHSCEPFSQREVEAAVTECDFAIYLAHTRLPTARLDQAGCEDMDLLVADNFARAAARASIRQIIHLHGITREGDISASLAGERSEVSDILRFYGIPVTTLRTGLIIAPGSSVLRLFGRMIQRFPVMILPAWANTQKQPIAVPDVIRAIRLCLGNKKTFDRSFDIGGTTILSVREMLRTWASALGRRRLILAPGHLHPRLFALYLRLIDRSTHPGLIRLLIESLRGNSLARDNFIQRTIQEKAVSAQDMLTSSLADPEGKLHPNPREALLGHRAADLRSKSTVRSVQRVALPNGRNATWVADTYFRWLPRFVRNLINCERDSSGSYKIYSMFPRMKLLELTFKPDHSSPTRRMYFITGGILSRWHGDPKPRMEFRDMLDGSFTIIAIHDFTPRLSWGLYTSTQALIHVWVMQAFQRYLDKKSQSLSSFWTMKRPTG